MMVHHWKQRLPALSFAFPLVAACAGLSVPTVPTVPQTPLTTTRFCDSIYPTIDWVEAAAAVGVRYALSNLHVEPASHESACHAIVATYSPRTTVASDGTVRVAPRTGGTTVGKVRFRRTLFLSRVSYRVAEIHPPLCQRA